MAKIADAFSLIRNGANIKQGQDDTGYPITRIETISNRTVDRNKMGYAGVTDITKYSDFVLQDGDILMSHINSETHLGKVARYEKRKDETIIHGMNLLCLRPKHELIESRFAFYYLSSEAFLRQIPRITKKSVNQASFNVATLKELTIPIPAFDEQLQIVMLLDKVGELIALRKKQLAKLDQLVKSRFAEMFGDTHSNPNHYPILPWREVFCTTTGKLDSNAMVEGGKYPFFTCAKEHFWIDTYAFDCEALLLAGNNAAGIYDVKYYNGKFNAYQRTYVLRLVDETWSYLLFKRQLEDKLAYLQTQSKGTNTRYLTLGILNELQFIVPPCELQKQFATFVEQTDKSKLTIQASLDKLELLKKSLMQQYFG